MSAADVAVHEEAIVPPASGRPTLGRRGLAARSAAEAGPGRAVRPVRPKIFMPNGPGCHVWSLSQPFRSRRGTATIRSRYDRFARAWREIFQIGAPRYPPPRQVLGGGRGVVSGDDPGAAGGFIVSFAAGSRIAGYRLEERIGQGGMAVVFRARDEGLGRSVALKILAPTLAGDAAFQRRFISESRAAAAIDDPHIVPVFAAGEADGVLFIAMRYVAGGDAHSLLDREGPLPPGRVAAIISPVASALDAAHGAGLLHRDVKPSNMLMDVLPGRPDHVYLSDFGLSKAVASTSGMTRAGEVMGTLDYMAPEQIAGQPVDGRTDQYALACSAFELLTGAPPFRRDEPTAVMYAHLSESPPRLTSRRPGLPQAANGVLSTALAKAPGDRYASCGQFADALRDAFGFPRYDSGPAVMAEATHPPTEIARPAPGVADPPGHANEHPGRAERLHRPWPAAPRQRHGAAAPAATAPGRAGRTGRGHRGRGGPDRESPAREHGQPLRGRADLGEIGRGGRQRRRVRRVPRQQAGERPGLRHHQESRERRGRPVVRPAVPLPPRADPGRLGHLAPGGHHGQLRVPGSPGPGDALPGRAAAEQHRVGAPRHLGHGCYLRRHRRSVGVCADVRPPGLP